MGSTVPWMLPLFFGVFATMHVKRNVVLWISWLDLESTQTKHYSFCKMALIYTVFIVFEEKKYSKILLTLQFLHLVKCVYDRYCHNLFLVFNIINNALIEWCMFIVTCLNTSRFKLHVDKYLPSRPGSVNLQNLQQLHFGCSKTGFCSGSCKTAW